MHVVSAAHTGPRKASSNQERGKTGAIHARAASYDHFLHDFSPNQHSSTMFNRMVSSLGLISPCAAAIDFSIESRWGRRILFPIAGFLDACKKHIALAWTVPVELVPAGVFRLGGHSTKWVAESSSALVFCREAVSSRRISSWTRHCLRELKCINLSVEIPNMTAETPLSTEPQAYLRAQAVRWVRPC